MLDKLTAFFDHEHTQRWLVLLAALGLYASTGHDAGTAFIHGAWLAYGAPLALACVFAAAFAATLQHEANDLVVIAALATSFGLLAPAPEDFSGLHAPALWLAAGATAFIFAIIIDGAEWWYTDALKNRVSRATIGSTVASFATVMSIFGIYGYSAWALVAYLLMVAVLVLWLAYANLNKLSYAPRVYLM